MLYYTVRVSITISQYHTHYVILIQNLGTFITLEASAFIHAELIHFLSMSRL
jgi:hypothetical protein